MPSIEQLKIFDQNIDSLGGEKERRTERGETLPKVSFPQNIPAEDDSYDFEFGLPEADEEVSEAATPDELDELDEVSGPKEEIELPDVDELFVPTDIDDSAFEDLLPVAGESDSAPPESAEPIKDGGDEDLELTNEIDDLFSTSEDGDLKSIEDIDIDEIDISEGFGTDSDFATDVSDEFSLNDGLDDSFNEGEAPQDSKTTESALPDMNDLDFSDVKISDISDLAFTDDDQSEDEHEAVDGFENSFDEEDFVIPGFSDKEFAKPHAKKTTITEEGKELPPNTITNKQYTKFKKNLSGYPLNLRLAIQKFIVEDEFKDEIVMDVVNKVIKKDTARHLASHMEKLLDISILVPLNYERRTVDEYNAYKKTLEFQLKNRIIPGVIAGVLLSLLAILLFFLGNRFLYKPIRAEIFYNQGYQLLANEEYGQSEQKFNEAVSFKASKKWYFKYARSYADAKQYERSRNMYERLLGRFNYDKKAGLEYARMELEQLQNYEKADFITRNYVLDFHINDKDAMLLLGDINLEWGDYSKNASEKAQRYEVARLEYADLIERHGQKDLYLSRMLRYFIRTDNLREVLPLKEYFMEQKKLKLDPIDLVEMGGYLLEKLFGYLSPSDEYLREYITGLRSVVEKAAKADPTIPEAHYNLGVYFQNDYKPEAALVSFNNALNMFENTKKRNFPRILKNIDTYRRQGEIYTQKQEYITAEQQLNKGISMFETEHAVNLLESDKNIGHLYSNLADIDYFISGNLNAALHNYQNAIENKYDVPSNRYRIGYI
ncbi:MAG TPA: hypothetical protein VFC68_05260, partial [Treponemataceae bacterium]|nr:hypothetical protein [Treponemataceae bacterium]